MKLEQYQKTEVFIKQHARKIEQAQFHYHFEGGSKEAVYEELTTYQNSDGGFGHGLEPDFLLPSSSPMATTIAFQILSKCGAREDNPLVQQGIDYFIKTYDASNQVWDTTPKEVNNFLHTPWWHYNEPKSTEDYIARNFPNPTPEIIGYLWEYQSLVPKELLESVTEKTIERLITHYEELEMHGMFCFHRLLKRIPRENQTVIRNHLKTYIEKHLGRTKEEWANYTATPSMFITTPTDPLFLFIGEQLMQEHLDYLLTVQECDGSWLPTWPSDAYKAEHWQQAKPAWQGIISLRYLKIFDNFNQITK